MCFAALVPSPVLVVSDTEKYPVGAVKLLRPAVRELRAGITGVSGVPVAHGGRSYGLRYGRGSRP